MRIENYKECRYCVYFNSGDCSRINDELKLDTNLVELVENGELSECLRENLEIDNVDDIVEEVFKFFLNRLEASIEVPVFSEFYCRYWR